MHRTGNIEEMLENSHLLFDAILEVYSDKGEAVHQQAFRIRDVLNSEEPLPVGIAAVAMVLGQLLEFVVINEVMLQKAGNHWQN